MYMGYLASPIQRKAVFTLKEENIKGRKSERITPYSKA